MIHVSNLFVIVLLLHQSFINHATQWTFKYDKSKHELMAHLGGFFSKTEIALNEHKPLKNALNGVKKVKASKSGEEDKWVHDPNSKLSWKHLAGPDTVLIQHTPQQKEWEVYTYAGHVQLENGKGKKQADYIQLKGKKTVYETVKGKKSVFGRFGKDTPPKKVEKTVEYTLNYLLNDFKKKVNEGSAAVIHYSYVGTKDWKKEYINYKGKTDTPQIKPAENTKVTEHTADDKRWMENKQHHDQMEAIKNNMLSLQETLKKAHVGYNDDYDEEYDDDYDEEYDDEYDEYMNEDEREYIKGFYEGYMKAKRLQERLMSYHG